MPLDTIMLVVHLLQRQFFFDGVYVLELWNINITVFLAFW